MYYSEEYINCYIESKRLKRDDLDLDKLDEIIHKSNHMVYNGVCLDIDKTITSSNNEQEIVSEELCKTLAHILHYENFLCFITGRGHNSAISFILKLIARIHNLDRDIPFSSFKRITCITGNGIYLYYTIGDDWMDLLQEKRSLVKSELSNKASPQNNNYTLFWNYAIIDT
jgi:hydroxymethylpyrimidine pyrophosphatase-like HAD family hydrolase